MAIRLRLGGTPLHEHYAGQPDSLTPEQREAVEYPPRPLMIVAGPGSGKTRVLTARVARIISGGCDPKRIFVATFTRKAAEEMRRRIAATIQPGTGEPQSIGTVHSRCLQLIRMLGPDRFGLQPGFDVASEDETVDLVGEILEDIYCRKVPCPVSGDTLDLLADSLAPEDVLAAISLGDETNQGLDAFACGDKDVLKLLEVCRGEYAKRMAAANRIDYTMMQSLVVRALLRDAQLLRLVQGMFDHVLVDEYQDSNRIQVLLFSLLAREHRSITVVGDVDQSIYEWRGAFPGCMLSFTSEWPGAKVIQLTVNHRSTENIVRASHRLISRNENRIDIPLTSRQPDHAGDPIAVIRTSDLQTQAEVAARIAVREHARGTPWSKIAVLYRLRLVAGIVERAFRRRRLPYVVYGSLPFFSRAEVRDVLAWLRLVQNPADWMSFSRAAMAPPRGIGRKTLDKIRSWLEANPGRSCIDACLKAGTGAVQGIAQPQSKALSDVAAIWHELVQANRHDKANLVHEVIRLTNYQDFLMGKEEDPKDRIAGTTRMDNLRDMASELEEAGRLEIYLASVNERLVGEDSVPKSGGDYVALSTIHAAKGREYDAVVIVGCQEGMTPCSSACKAQDGRTLLLPSGGLEEERRIFYVGMTRARYRLYLLYSDSTLDDGYLWPSGNGRPMRPSRFLGELSGQGVVYRG